MSLLAVAGANSASGAYDIDNSLKFESNNSEKLYYTLSGNGDLQQMSFSCWVKRTELGSEQAIFTGRLGASGEFGRLIFSPSDTIQFWMRDSGNITLVQLYTNRVFRDTSAWYHIVFGIDTTQSTAADRVNLYINGVKETSFSSETYPTLNANLNGGFNRSTFNHVLGVEEANNTYFNGYIAEAHFVDGQQLAASDFGDFDSATGIWKPKAYTGSYGTKGFYLDFESSGSLGADSSGNGNNFTLNNITSADQATDTPTNNFCTLNPLSAIYGSITYTQGATDGYASVADSLTEGTIGFTNGKWYYEIVMPSESGNPNANMMMGFGRPNFWSSSGDTYNFAYNRTGVVFYNGTTTGGYSGWVKDDVVMLAIDADNGFAYFGVNGTWGLSADPTSGATGTGGFNYDSLVTNMSIGDLLIPTLKLGNAGNIFEVNFGGFTGFPIASGNTDENGYGNFEYAPPSGYYALCSKNLAEFG